MNHQHVEGAILVIIILSLVALFVQTGMLQGEIGKTNTALDTATASDNQRIAAGEQKTESIESFIESSGLDCNFVTHAPIAGFDKERSVVGADMCRQQGYQFCLLTTGQIQESFFSSMDGSCSGSGYPQRGKDFETRVFSCSSSIDEQTKNTYADGIVTTPNSGMAVCIRGGPLNTDHWQTLLNTKSYCCKYATIDDTGTGKINPREPGHIIP